LAAGKLNLQPRAPTLDDAELGTLFQRFGKSRIVAVGVAFARHHLCADHDAALNPLETVPVVSGRTRHDHREDQRAPGGAAEDAPRRNKQGQDAERERETGQRGRGSDLSRIADPVMPEEHVVQQSTRPSDGGLGPQRQLQVCVQLRIARPIRQGAAIASDRSAPLAGPHVGVALVIEQRARHHAAIEDLLVQDSGAEIVFRPGGLVKGFQGSLVRAYKLAFRRSATTDDGR